MVSPCPGLSWGPVAPVPLRPLAPDTPRGLTLEGVSLHLPAMPLRPLLSPEREAGARGQGGSLGTPQRCSRRDMKPLCPQASRGGGGITQAAPHPLVTGPPSPPHPQRPASWSQTGGICRVLFNKLLCGHRSREGGGWRRWPARPVGHAALPAPGTRVPSKGAQQPRKGLTQRPGREKQKQR